MLRPTLDNVVVKKIEPEGKSKGGILLPDNAKKETFTGTVVAVGPGKADERGRIIPVCAVKNPIGDDELSDDDQPYLLPGVKTGDVAVFNQYAGNKVKVEEEEYLILQAEEVLAILPPPPAETPESFR